MDTFQKEFAEDIDMALSDSQKLVLQKTQTILFLGQLLGLPTLKSILTKFDITSNSLQISCKKFYKSLTINKIRRIFEFIFETQLQQNLADLCSKDSSIFSKTLVTLVLDDSIFRQWLQNVCADIDFEDFYGCFFSGQYKASIYGYKVLTLAVSIEGILYPLYFEFVRKVPVEAPEGEKKEPEPIQSAKKLVKKWGLFKSKLASQEVNLPDLHLSCDSGYNDKSLSAVCLENALTYISVPKKSHCFEVDNKKIKLSDWITKVYLEDEKVHQKEQEALPKEEKTAFVIRQRAVYVSQKQEVTLLAFRLNGSKKVSVIYSTGKNIFAKTLRRHWFQRTYIEQFFKMLKHVLQISEARVRNKDEFENKLLQFAFMALQAQKLIKFLRKKIKEFENKGFIALQRILNSDTLFLDLLQSYL